MRYVPQKELALRDVSRTLAHLGHYEEAKRIVSGFCHHYVKIEMLIEIAKLQAQTSDSSQTLQLAKQLAALDGKALEMVGIAEAELGACAAAHQTAAMITDPEHKGKVLITIAQEEARAGKIEEAKQTASGILDRELRAPATCVIAQVEAQSEQYEAAQQTASNIGPVYWRERTLMEIAKIVAEQGRLEIAQEIVDKVTTQFIKTQILTAIVGAQAAEKQFDLAKQTAGEIEDPVEQVTALLIIALANEPADEQLYHVAKQKALAIELIESKRSALMEIAHAETRWGKYETALETVFQIDHTLGLDNYEQMELIEKDILQIVKEAVSNGQVEAALKAAYALDKPYFKWRVLAKIAQALAQIGEYKKAMETAAGIEELYWKACALGKIAHTEFQAKEYEAASVTFQLALQTTDQVRGAREKIGAYLKLTRFQV